MIIFDYDPKSGISCGINDYGELFLGGNGSRYNLPNTQENVEYILADFKFWTK